MRSLVRCRSAASCLALPTVPGSAPARRALASAAGPPAPTNSLPFGAPVLPFHHAFPVHNLDLARAFYRDLLGCEEGRSSKTWIDYNFWGHQIVCHWAGDGYRCQDHFNSVDIDMVPVPHFGVCLTVPQFEALAARLKAQQVRFVVEPHLRFPGEPGEQWTMFFKDPSGNNIEMKALTKQDNLFASACLRGAGRGARRPAGGRGSRSPLQGAGGRAVGLALTPPLSLSLSRARARLTHTYTHIQSIMSSKVL